jgi:hypothetical protein
MAQAAGTDKGKDCGQLLPQKPRMDTKGHELRGRESLSGGAGTQRYFHSGRAGMRRGWFETVQPWRSPLMQPGELVARFGPGTPVVRPPIAWLGGLRGVVCQWF